MRTPFTLEKIPQHFRITFSSDRFVFALNLIAFVDMLAGIAMMVFNPYNIPYLPEIGLVVSVGNAVFIRLDLAKTLVSLIVQNCSDRQYTLGPPDAVDRDYGGPGPEAAIAEAKALARALSRPGDIRSVDDSNNDLYQIQIVNIYNDYSTHYTNSYERPE